MNIKLIYLQILLVLVLSACSTIISLEVPSDEPFLVIDAWLNNGYIPQTVRLTKSVNLFDLNSSPVVSNAVISVENMTDNRVFNFVEEALSNKYIWIPGEQPDSLGKVGDIFTLTVTYENNTYTASSEINRTTEIDSIAVTLETEPFEDFSFIELEFFARDPTGEGDAYWIRNYKNGILDDNPLAISIVYDAAFNPGSGFDGNIFIPPIREVFNTFDLDDTARVELYSLTEEGFIFLQQLVEQSVLTQGLFSVPIGNVSSNISSTDSNAPIAVGFFSVCGRTYKDVVIDITDSIP